MISYWWVPVIILWEVAYAYCSIKNNLIKSDLWFWITFFVGLCPLWAFVSKYSKNLVFDGFLYDIVLSLSFYMAILCLGAGKGFTFINYVGVSMIMLGFIFLKIGN